MRKPLLYIFMTILLVRAWIWFSENELASGVEDQVAGAADEAQITVGADGARPHVVSVRAGAEVYWTNESGQPRTLDAAGKLGNPQIAPGETFEWEAADPGVIHYTLDAEGQEGQIVILEEGEQLFDGRTVEAEFQDSCSGCHGPDRRGAIGPALLPERLTETDQFYFETIRDGRLGTVMTAWGEQRLTEKEIWMLVGYIRSN